MTVTYSVYWAALIIVISTTIEGQFQLPDNPTKAQIDSLNRILRGEVNTNAFAQTTQGEVAFKKLGETSYRMEFVNVLLVEDYESIQYAGTLAASAIRKIREASKQNDNPNYPHFGISTSVRHTLQTTETLLLQLNNDIVEFKLLANPWTEHAHGPAGPSRTKRGFAGDLIKSAVQELPLGNLAWWGIKTIGSSLFGWFSNTEADEAKKQAQAQGRTLTLMRKALAALEYNQDNDRKAIRAIITDQADLRSEILVDGYATSIAEAAARHQREWARFLAIYDAATGGKLSVKALAGREVQQIKTILVEAAAAKNLVIPINSGNDFLQCPISFTVDSRYLNIVVHVPAAPQDSLLHIFSYIPMPLPLSNGGVATPQLTNTIIAINPTQDRFAILSAYDMLQCKPLGGLFYCPDLNTVRRPTPLGPDEYNLDEGMCLFALITHQLDQALRRCPVTLSQEPDIVRQLGKGKFLIHAKNDQEAQWDCNDDTLAPANLLFTLEGGKTTNVLVKDGCQGITKTHIFANPDNSRSDEWDRANVFETSIIQMPDDLANSSVAYLQQEAYRLLGQRDPITLEEALQTQTELDQEETTSSFRVVLFATAGVAAFAGLGIFTWITRAFWISLFGSAKRTKMQSLMDSQVTTAKTLCHLVATNNTNQTNTNDYQPSAPFPPCV